MSFFLHRRLPPSLAPLLLLLLLLAPVATPAQETESQERDPAPPTRKEDVGANPLREPSGPKMLRDDPVPARPREKLPNDGAETLRVLGLVRVESTQGGFVVLDLAGRSGILVDELSSAGTLQRAPVFRFWGRMRKDDSVSRFRDLAAEEDRLQALWLAWARVPAQAEDPIPLTTLVWSPLLYPNRASTLTRGPAGSTRYYIEPGSSAVLESTNEGKDFRTAFTAARTPEFVEGGRGWDLTRIFWRAKVSSWLEKQEKIRRAGEKKYGPLLQDSE